MRMSKTKPIGEYTIFCTQCCTEAKPIISTTPRSLNNSRHKKCGAVGQMVFVYSELEIPQLKLKSFSISAALFFVVGFMLAMLIATASK